jgi:hypothetical protein
MRLPFEPGEYSPEVTSPLGITYPTFSPEPDGMWALIMAASIYLAPDNRPALGINTPPYVASVFDPRTMRQILAEVAEAFKELSLTYGMNPEENRDE